MKRVKEIMWGETRIKALKPNYGELPDTPRLCVTKEEADLKLQARIESGKELINRQISTYEQLQETKREFKKWLDYNKAMIDQILTPSKVSSPYNTVYEGLPPGHTRTLSRHEVQFFHQILQERISELESIKDCLELWEEDSMSSALPADKTESAIDKVRLICDRFHHVVRALRRRHNGRATLDVTDEYDVQDLMRALLTLFFEDIREEEWTPSYAGGAAKMDFLLKEEQVVVETKRTREGLTPKKLGDELLVDVGRYREHPDCKVLVCFVYDLDGRIPNPRGFENDWARQSTDQLRVMVLIR